MPLPIILGVLSAAVSVVGTAYSAVRPVARVLQQSGLSLGSIVRAAKRALPGRQAAASARQLERNIEHLEQSQDDFVMVLEVKNREIAERAKKITCLQRVLGLATGVLIVEAVGIAVLAAKALTHVDGGECLL